MLLNFKFSSLDICIFKIFQANTLSENNPGNQENYKPFSLNTKGPFYLYI